MGRDDPVMESVSTGAEPSVAARVDAQRRAQMWNMAEHVSVYSEVDLEVDSGLNLLIRLSSSKFKCAWKTSGKEHA